MPASKQMLSYPDIQENMDLALQSPRGIAIEFQDPAAARRFLARSNSFRKLCRDKNKILYPDPGHSLHHECIYDSLILKLSPDKMSVIYQKPGGVGDPKIKEL